ncbi:hypothetical protein KP509_32G010700 [Ceratopteris richardii]|uniref:NPH3 domain-containing protein n=1 Tax=Ceratopteris richardii TaxID=49495 RepID=A0A8T2QSR2_CERRI|nr:hypothetical protein KP509_32G010700 [Ceratopteris richardii]
MMMYLIIFLTCFQFPLISKSGKLSQLIGDAVAKQQEIDEDPSDNEDNVCCVRLDGIPGGISAFEHVVKFCYGAKVELSTRNVISLRCASEYLNMTDEYGERNLISITEAFIQRVVVPSWKNCAAALSSCTDELLPMAEKLSIISQCVTSMANKVYLDPYNTLNTCPTSSVAMRDNKAGPTNDMNVLLWNGISNTRRSEEMATVAMDWWFDDVATLSLPLFTSLIELMKEKGVMTDAIVSAVVYYARQHIPGLNRRQYGSSKQSLQRGHPSPRSTSASRPPCDIEQLSLLESIERLLPTGHGVVSTPFLFTLLRISFILNASRTCRSSLESRIGMQLEQASVDDLLIPNYSSSETLYDVDCIERLMQRFLKSISERGFGAEDGTHSIGVTDDQVLFIPQVATVEKENGNRDGILSPAYGGQNLSNAGDQASRSFRPSFLDLQRVASLLDDCLREIAADKNVHLSKFQTLAQCLPHNARTLEDDLYSAIDVFMKVHPSMSEEEKEVLCGVVDWKRMSSAAYSHAAQNDKLPVRVAIQALFAEQQQLRTAILQRLDEGNMRPLSTVTSDIVQQMSGTPIDVHVQHRSITPIPRNNQPCPIGYELRYLGRGATDVQGNETDGCMDEREDPAVASATTASSHRRQGADTAHVHRHKSMGIQTVRSGMVKLQRRIHKLELHKSTHLRYGTAQAKHSPGSVRLSSKLLLCRSMAEVPSHRHAMRNLRVQQTSNNAESKSLPESFSRPRAAH